MTVVCLWTACGVAVGAEAADADAEAAAEAALRPATLLGAHSW